MSYRLLVLDIDGTLRPSGQDRVPRAVAEAVCAVQRSGVRVAIATGRGRCCIRLRGSPGLTERSGAGPPAAPAALSLRPVSRGSACAR